MFTSGLVEGSTHSQKDVALHDVPKDALSAIVEYMYTARILINNENVQV